MIRLIFEDHNVKLYHHNTIGGMINVYHFKTGEVMFGAEKITVLNRFYKTHVCKSIYRVLTHKINNHGNSRRN